MKTILIIVATISALVGLLLFFAPKALIRTSEVLNREISTEEHIFSRRILFGILLLVLGMIMVYFLIWG
ncbi:MAG: hypothetical protein ISR95_00975 [Candidatus Marinimicrobia bacterium]|nr:hypothetical protein [Candidatus Neomarinimicrobiota bacterium]